MFRREPTLRFVNFHRVQLLAFLGRTKEACQLADETVAENATDMFAQIVTAVKYAILGERDSLIDLIGGKLESYFWNDPEFPEWIAGWFATVGERDRAFHWLERWPDRGNINYPLAAHVDPMLEPLRGESRFQGLLDRVRPEWEGFTPAFGSFPSEK